MIDGLEITPLQFDHNTSYVLVKLDIGKMTPNTAKKYVERCRESMSLFKELEGLGIPYDIVGVRGRKDIKIETKTKTENTATDSIVRARRGLLNSMAARNERLKARNEPDLDVPAPSLQNATEGMATTPDNFADAMKLVE